MNRRHFLKTSTLSLGTVGLATSFQRPLILGAEKKSQNNRPTVGIEGHMYECWHNWGELPADYSWQTSHNVALDSSGMVYITHQGVGKKMDTVLVFDNKGKFVRSFGQEFHGGGHGIEIRKEGSEEFIYLSNTWTPELKVMKTTLQGKVVWKMGRPECKEYENPKVKYNPTNICFTPDGGFIVGDGYGSAYMLCYDKEAKLRHVFGGAGTTLGKLRTPHGQWIDNREASKPRLLVCDRANARLQYFSLEGKPLSATKSGETVLFPAHAKTRGDVLLVPDLHARVSLFDKNLKPIVHLGDDESWRKKVLGVGAPAKAPKVRTQPKLWLPGKFVHPHDAAFDHEGNIFVVEWVSTGRITFLKKVG